MTKKCVIVESMKAQLCHVLIETSLNPLSPGFPSQLQ